MGSAKKGIDFLSERDAFFHCQDTPVTENGEIVSIGGYKIGDVVWKTEKKPYRIVDIKSLSLFDYRFDFFVKTLASTFITPMIFHSKNHCLWDTGFINTYVGDLQHGVDVDEEMIFFLYRYDGRIQSENYIKLLSEMDGFLGEYSPDDYHRIIVFEAPEKYRENLLLFSEGRYSQFSDEYKSKICTFHSQTGNELVKSILYRLEGRVELLSKTYNVHPDDLEELYPPPVMMKEVYTQELNLNVIF